MRARGIARATSRASTAVSVSGNSPGGAHTSGADLRSATRTWKRSATSATPSNQDRVAGDRSLAERLSRKLVRHAGEVEGRICQQSQTAPLDDRSRTVDIRQARERLGVHVSSE